MSLKKLKLLFVRFTNMIYDALVILESFCTMIALENILELIWELPLVQCSASRQMISLKQLMMMMRKWQKPLLQLSWPWLPGAEQLFTPSRLALVGDEADEEEGRQGKGEEGKE